MKKYKIIAGDEPLLQLEASTLEELFEAAMSGVSQLSRQPEAASEKQMESGEPDTEKNIALKAENVTALLTAFLSALLKITQEEKAIFTKVLFLDFDEKSLDAEIFGYQVAEGLMEDVPTSVRCESGISQNKQGKWEGVIAFGK